MTSNRLAPALAITLILAACSAAPPAPASSARPEPARAALPGPRGGAALPPPSATPKPLAGTEGVELEKREAELVWQLVSQLYAPCPSEAVSIAQCVQEDRPCAACRPAARLLAEKVRDGATAEQAREMYAVRFGPGVTPIDAADSPARGPADAPVTIVVWSDFECPHCRHAMPVLDRLVEKFSPRVRLVHKFYPLRHHSHAEGSARAAIAAQNQGKYWEMEAILFAHQSDQTDSDVERYAKEIGLDLKRFRTDVQAPRTTKILERDHADAERAGLSGTPYIVVNGRPFDTTYFHIGSDLDAWIRLELTLGSVTGQAAAR